MPIINITTWPTAVEVKQKMMEDITRVVHEISGAPLDKITVFVQEIEKNSWSDAGVVGTNADFPKKSRRINYDK